MEVLRFFTEPVCSWCLMPSQKHFIEGLEITTMVTNDEPTYTACNVLNQRNCYTGLCDTSTKC